jgi:hypothetical protein
VPSLEGAWYPLRKMSRSETTMRLRDTNLCASTLLCSLDLPGIVWPSILVKDVVVDTCVDVLGIDECAVYIEDACAHRR